MYRFIRQKSSCGGWQRKSLSKRFLLLHNTAFSVFLIKRQIKLCAVNLFELYNVVNYSMVGEYSSLLTIKFLKFVFIELTLSLAESFYTVDEDAGVLSVSVTVSGTTDIIVTGRYVTFIDFCQEYNSSIDHLIWAIFMSKILHPTK